MFSACFSLESVKIGYEGLAQDAPTDALTGWISRVFTAGTSYYTGSDPDSITNFGFPKGWTINPN
jgi:hypothetical protein